MKLILFLVNKCKSDTIGAPQGHCNYGNNDTCTIFIADYPYKYPTDGPYMVYTSTIATL